jgi:hypothetical protein
MDRQPLTDRLGDRLLAEYGGATAAYSLRALNGNGDSVVRVRRASDNDEKDFTAEQIELGEMVNWVNSQTVPPLDIGVETSEGRIPVPEGGTSIGTPAAAYSLRNLSTTYTGNVVDVRRSSGGTESFTAAEVADGTLEAWVSEDTTQYMQFDGVDDFVQSTTVPDIASSTVTITLEYTANEAQFIELQSAGAFHLVGTLNSTVGGSNDLVVGSHNSDNPSSGAKFRYNGLTVGDVITIVLNIDATYQITSATVNGASMTTAGSGASRQETSSKTTLRLGRRAYDAGIAYAGYFTNFSVSTDSTYDWDGTEAGAISNGWTVGGSPISPLLNDGFVTKWYDQSGNDNHATQGTAAKQPKIVDGGSLVSGGLEFDGVDDVLGTSLVPPNEATLIGVANWDIEDQSTMIIGARDSVNQRSYLAQTSSGQSAIGVSSSALPDVDIVAGDDYLLFGVHSGLTRLLSTNGSVISDSGGSAPNNTIHGYSVGALNTVGTNGSFMDGTLAEVIVYPSDQSANRTAIEANIGETYGITGIPAYDNTVDGFVETWYDQSGNGNDARQSVAASQPKIVNAGVFLGEVDFLDGVNTFLETTNSALCNVDELSVFSVLKPFIAQSQAVAFSCGSVVLNSSAYGGWRLNFNGYLNKAEFQTQAVGNSSGSTVSNDVGGSYTLLSYVADFPDASTFANGQAGLTSTNNISPNNPDSLRRRFRIGCQYTFTRAGFYPEPIKEIILYTSDQSSNRVAIETNINAHYNIYP